MSYRGPFPLSTSHKLEKIEQCAPHQFLALLHSPAQTVRLLALPHFRDAHTHTHERTRCYSMEAPLPSVLEFDDPFAAHLEDLEEPGTTFLHGTCAHVNIID